MGYFLNYYIRRQTDDGSYVYRLKTFDSECVESWEYIDEEHTAVTMKSGDKIILQVNVMDFGEEVINLEDAYGKLLVISSN